MILRTVLIGKDLLRAITEKRFDGIVNEKAFRVIIHSWGNTRLRAIQKCKLAKEVSDRLQKGYVERSIIRKRTLINKLRNMRYN